MSRRTLVSLVALGVLALVAGWRLRPSPAAGPGPGGPGGAGSAAAPGHAGAAAARAAARRSSPRDTPSRR